MVDPYLPKQRIRPGSTYPRVYILGSGGPNNILYFINLWAYPGLMTLTLTMTSASWAGLGEGPNTLSIFHFHKNWGQGKNNCYSPSLSREKRRLLKVYSSPNKLFYHFVTFTCLASILPFRDARTEADSFINFLVTCTQIRFTQKNPSPEVSGGTDNSLPDITLTWTHPSQG
jgi:hypothetical protein